MKKTCVTLALLMLVGLVGCGSKKAAETSTATASTNGGESWMQHYTEAVRQQYAVKSDAEAKRGDLIAVSGTVKSITSFVGTQGYEIVLGTKDGDWLVVLEGTANPRPSVDKEATFYGVYNGLSDDADLAISDTPTLYVARYTVNGISRKTFIKGFDIADSYEGKSAMEIRKDLPPTHTPRPTQTATPASTPAPTATPTPERTESFKDISFTVPSGGIYQDGKDEDNKWVIVESNGTILWSAHLMTTEPTLTDVSVETESEFWATINLMTEAESSAMTFGDKDTRCWYARGTCELGEAKEITYTERMAFKVKGTFYVILCFLDGKPTATDAERAPLLNFLASVELTGTAAATATFESGQYEIGTDMPAGEYVLEAYGSSAYFAITTDANGDDIYANDNFSNHSIVTVKDGQYLELSRCNAVPIDEAENYAEGLASLPEGMYKIGLHLPAGKYKLEATGSRGGYYGLYNSSTHKNIVSNDNFDGSRYVSVKDGQYLVLSRCELIVGE